MGQLTESARQCLVSQGIVIGSISVLVSLSLMLMGVVVVTRADDILHFTSLIHLAVLQLVCGLTSTVVVTFVWWIVVGYRNRQLDIRSKYLDDNLTKGLLALLVPVFLNYSAFLVSAAFLIVKRETSSRHEMRNALSLYTTCMKKKIFIDRLQVTLQCCGSQSIMDWFLIDWQGIEDQASSSENNNSSMEWDSVPYSCCRPDAPSPCIHHQLRVFGVASLYSTGCAEKLDRAVLMFILVSLLMFMIESAAMSLLMYSSRKLQTSARSAVFKGDATAPGEWWIFTPQTSTVECLRKEEEPLMESQYSDDQVRSPQNVTITEFCFTQDRCLRDPDLFHGSKIIDSTLNEDWTMYNPDSVQAEVTSSNDFPAKISHETLQSISPSTAIGTSMYCNCSADSRRSVSDTAVANLEVSHHFEHKIRPLYKT